MKRPFYTFAPAAHDRAQRAELNPIGAAYAVERFERASTAYGWLLKGIALLFAVVAVVHLVAMVWPQ